MLKALARYLQHAQDGAPSLSEIQITVPDHTYSDLGPLTPWLGAGGRATNLGNLILMNVKREGMEGLGAIYAAGGFANLVYVSLHHPQLSQEGAEAFLRAIGVRHTEERP